MNIVWLIHGYPPNLSAGSEFMAHYFNKYFKQLGWDVKVLIKDRGYSSYTYDGVDVVGFSGMPDSDVIRQADVLFTHLDHAEFTIKYAAKVFKPVVFVSHNTWEYKSVRTHPRTFVIYNCHGMKELLKRYMNDSVVVYPTIDIDYYNVNEDLPYDNEFITLINLNENKGGKVLQKLAAELPEVKFLGVIGAYSDQMTKQPANVKVIDTTQDIREIYKQTKVLLVLSEYESWGRVATEAMCNGIPVIATDTFGLKENLGESGIFVNRSKIKDIVGEIKKLEDKEYYTKKSEEVRHRAKELQQINKKQLEELTDKMKKIWHNRSK